MQFSEAVNEFAEFLIPAASNLITQDDATISAQTDFRACNCVTVPSAATAPTCNTSQAQNTKCASIYSEFCTAILVSTFMVSFVGGFMWNHFHAATDEYAEAGEVVTRTKKGFNSSELEDASFECPVSRKTSSKGTVKDIPVLEQVKPAKPALPCRSESDEDTEKSSLNQLSDTEPNSFMESNPLSVMKQRTAEIEAQIQKMRLKTLECDDLLQKTKQSRRDLERFHKRASRRGVNSAALAEVESQIAMYKNDERIYRDLKHEAGCLIRNL
eukprot:GHVP01055230.1.p1 GENE.GHVP01055230.1~~GHVP01055230.1.p1  ORF type:complete len:271 (+),score=42.93 GHVP01055230.1:14-826(+)